MVADSLTTYDPTDEELRPLRVFQGPPKKTLERVYQDLEANVTRIYQRRAMHLAMDLVWHSMCNIPDDSGPVKGWSEALVIGDSAQGKTETAMALMRHYRLGERVECKNASVAGLLGGCQQYGTKWFVTWGIIPIHDRRLVILEELKGASTEVIAKLTDMRSSGVAEIPKIEKRRTHARTRLLALSNPRGDKPLASYNFGLEAIRELIGSMEDVRRFDLIVMTATGDVDSAKLHDTMENPPQVPPVFTSDLCHRLVLWAWTRRHDQVVIPDDARKEILAATRRLCARFTDVVPIVDRGSMRLKLTRLAAALAARLFSCDESMRRLVVRPEHVTYVADFLDEEYSRPVFGYLEFSEAIRVQSVLIGPDSIRKRLNQTPHPADLADQFLHSEGLVLNDLRDWTAWDTSQALDLLSFLVRRHALVRRGREYVKNPRFIELLREMRQDGSLRERPEWTEEEF